MTVHVEIVPTDTARCHFEATRRGQADDTARFEALHRALTRPGEEAG